MIGVSSLCLVRECRELEEMCGVAFTDRLLKGELMCMGKELEGGDQESGSCTATGQMWSESPPHCKSGEASWMGKTLGSCIPGGSSC